MFTSSQRTLPRSQAERMWLIGGGLLAFVLLVIGYFFFIAPQRSDTADLESQNESVQTQNTVLQARIGSLRAQSKQMPRYRAELVSAKKALPDDSGISDFLRTLQSLGNSTLTDVSSLNVGAPVSLAQAAAPAGGSSSPAAGGSSPSSSSASSAPGSVPGVYSLAITAQVTGSPSALIKFLDQLQSVQPRAVLISQITQSAGTTGTTGKSGSANTLSLTMQAFVAPAASTGSGAAGAPAAPSVSPSK